MKNSSVALGIYQNLTTAEDVLVELRRKGVRRVAAVHHRADGNLVVHNWWSRVDRRVIARYQDAVMDDEVLVIAEIPPSAVRKVLGILREVKAGHPVSFLLRSEIPTIGGHDVGDKVSGEPLTLEGLEVYAAQVASLMSPAEVSRRRVSKHFAKRLNTIKQTLRHLRDDISDAEYIEQTITSSAQWLLDNSYAINSSIEEIKKNLPESYYAELPKLVSGPHAGMPRIYAIAREFIQSAAGRLTRENICAFLKGYQTIQSLTIGELWALPLMLRYRLLELIEALSWTVDQRMRDGELANFWGNRLLNVARRKPDDVSRLLSMMTRDQPEPSFHFAEELLNHLFDEETVLPMVKQWFEGRYRVSSAEIIHQEQISEASEQLTFSSLMVSLISLSQLSWPVIFEAVSLVNETLNRDPVGIYPEMDFGTRNRYRQALENVARGSGVEEGVVASRVLQLASRAKEAVEQHVGYYLIDDGRPALEAAVGYRAVGLRRVRKVLRAHPACTYVGGIVLLTVVLESLFLFMTLATGVSGLQAGLMALAALLPLSEISVQIVNFLLARLLPPEGLSKMAFEEGIPLNCRTLVVVPTMLLYPEGIQEELNRLEIRYLANTDEALKFALLGDFADATQAQMPDDEELLRVAKEGIEALDAKYGPGKFFLFYRGREWSESEGAWIGWERKRGKIEQLNRFIIDESASNFFHTGVAEEVRGVEYVITLDADTQLPKGKARELVAVLAHPLNEPYLSADGRSLVRGYSLIQPRVSTDFPQTKTSYFTRIFSEPWTVDPYTRAISNVYQDLTGEGTYHGKGIYHVRSFHSIVGGRFPVEHLLSHDLLEGVFARVAFASDVCLLDLFPADYLTWSKREHRWMRGDWQIADWLFFYTPSGRNTLSALNRWKIFDNLRRALLPVSLVLLLLCDWFMSAGVGLGTAIVLFVLTLPTVSLLLGNMFALTLPALLYWQEVALCLVRLVVNTSLLLHQALNAVDAMVRVFYRRLVSHRHLLQWMSFTGSAKGPSTMRGLVLCAVFGFAVLVVLALTAPKQILFALPFGVFWMISPLLVRFMDTSTERLPDRALTERDRQMLREIARRTWRYFDDFVSPQSNWLPPDNFQEALKVEVAMRTSPTNIGLWLLALLNAYDFAYITLDDLLERLSSTMVSLGKLERFEGHFLNWYDISTLNPLYPRYISTVDSGNLIACLWTLQEGLVEDIKAPLLSLKVIDGLKDTYALLVKDAGNIPGLQKELSEPAHDLLSLIGWIHSAAKAAEALTMHMGGQNAYWAERLTRQLHSWEATVSRYFSWVEIFVEVCPHRLKKELPTVSISLEDLASGRVTQNIEMFMASVEADPELNDWHKRLKGALETAQWLAGETLSNLQKLLNEIELMANEMNLKYLYNVDRKVFSIGYNLETRRLDPNYYDLLASEARLASLVGIAKEDVPVEHWWALGRPYALVDGRHVLLSWGGTMFEYLMPLLLNRHYPDSLLGNGCAMAVACQIDYGQKRGICWGISESAFSVIDASKTYQYRSFGVPGTGLKRGLEEDLVVSPYSSALALMIDPKAAAKNLHELIHRNPQSMLGPYGLYESVDFTGQTDQTGERGIIVYAYMAHHQGMIFGSINNLLHNSILNTRFHSDPRVMGVESLLYERVPTSVPVSTQNYQKRVVVSRLVPFSSVPVMGMAETPDSVLPKVNLLSNGHYSIMVTNSGGGYSMWGDYDVTRWRADTTCDGWGTFCYVKDLDSGAVWSNTYQPTRTSGRQYSVSFKGDKVEFTRKDQRIETRTEIIVSPEDNVEIRLITLINHSKEVRRLEVTSYAELVLAPRATDRAHPAFNKFFVETESLPHLSALLAFRRLRSKEDQPLWAGHRVVGEESGGQVQYETDRAKFVGRGGTVQHPVALDHKLSNSAGTTLDPIFSLRKQVTLEPGRRMQIAFVTGVGGDRSTVASLMEKYQDFSVIQRAFELSWNYAQLELRHLRVQPEEVQLYQKLASRILYPHLQLRASQARLRSNRLGQSKLWAYGISGDLPIVVVTVRDLHETDIVRQSLIAHNFWRLRGLKVDLVILNEEEVSYDRPIRDQINRILEAYAERSEIDKPGGVFLRNKDDLSREDLTLLLCSARALLIAARGTFRQQLVSPLPATTYPANLPPKRKVPEALSKPLPFLELSHFNGLGGFSPDGKTYAIYLDRNQHTPQPWINVMANPMFGTMVSEAGCGCTWYGNSQTNRLTPWSNDPVVNPIADVIYIRDEESQIYWTATPGPIRELDAYRITHGQGYSRFEHNSHGLEQELVVFVPVDEQGGLPLRVQRLRIKNNSGRRRSLTVTSYADLVLGTNRDETQMHVYTEWDALSQSLHAYNRYHADYSSHVAFVSSSPPARSFTGDRAEFIGRNNGLNTPAAMRRSRLSGHISTGLDPCAALQISVELEPGVTTEVVFVLGYAEDQAQARVLTTLVREPNKVEELLNQTTAWWEHTLQTVQIEVPDPTINLLLNRWLLYQTLSCRFWGRAAFYQSSGAYGFRDQLQDAMGLIYSHPELARAHILKTAARQFVEGDVQHWWHPQSGLGVRTRISDDLLWLPFVTAHYVRVTGDLAVLDESIPFLDAPLLADNEHEVVSVPAISMESGTLLEHCLRAIRKGSTSGVNGLPLMGGGDWNDGMNRVGIEGKGESVWLGWFLIHVLHDYAELLERKSQKEEGLQYIEQATRLAQAIEANGWDGGWYRRAYFDDETPLGTKDSSEAKIDSIAQSWSVISGAGEKKRSRQALLAAEQHLARDGIVRLLTPPFDQTSHDPGYIKGYPPGVRENGGQYTHGSLWLPMAFARLGDGDKAVSLLQMMNPINHALNAEQAALYRLEPYVLAGDVYDLPGQVGRGGWSWYSGASAWMYRVWLEEVCGFVLRENVLRIDPVIPCSWDGFKILYRYGKSMYRIVVENPQHVGRSVKVHEIKLVDDGQDHEVRVVMAGDKDNKDCRHTHHLEL